MGPLMTAANPRSSARRLSSTNSWGLTQRSMGWCSLEGRRYWVMVRMSQRASTRSARACSTSSRVSPMPRMRLDLVTRPASLAARMTSREPR